MGTAFVASRPFGRRRRRRAGAAEWLLLVCSTTVLAAVLVTAELRLRAASDDDFAGPAAMRRLHRFSEAYGWEPRPGFTGLIEGMRTTIDGRGARGPRPRPEPAGARRVLVLGDSIAFGWGVRDEQTFSALLDGDPGTSVTNLAVEGYGLDQTLLRFEREGRALRPHVVVVSFCVANDFVDTALPAFLYDGATPKPYFRVEDGELRLHDDHLRRPPLHRALAALEERFELVRRLRERDGPGAASGPHWSDVANQVMARRSGTLELTLRLLERLSAQARAQGARVVLLLHPSRRTYLGREGGLETDLLRSGRLRDLTVVDLRERHRDKGLAFDDFALDRVGHLSPRGHREATDVLRDLLGG